MSLMCAAPINCTESQLACWQRKKLKQAVALGDRLGGMARIYVEGSVMQIAQQEGTDWCKEAAATTKLKHNSMRNAKNI